MRRESDERVQTFLNRSIEGEPPFIWLDATYVKARREQRIVSVAVIVAVVAIRRCLVGRDLQKFCL